MQTYTIRQLVEQIHRGQVRIPAFQRGFVWDPDHVAYLMDSIYKRFPFGSLLFWRTREQLKADRKLGPFLLPDPQADYPIDYVLDGQQRVTSLFGTFQTEIQPENWDGWKQVYFDFEANASPQEPQFQALADGEADPARYFPLRVLFDTVEFRRATEGMGQNRLRIVDDLQTRFREAQIPVQLSDLENKAAVAIIFERINRQGVPLDTLQLLSAWTWSDDFQLQTEFDALKDELSPFGFHAVGEDTNLVLRCCSAVVAGDASPEALMALTGEQIREHFPAIINGLKGSIDFLRSNLSVEALWNLPYSTVLVPLTVYFATERREAVPLPDAHRRVLLRWFWQSCFSRRYSSGVLRSLKEDIESVAILRRSGDTRLASDEYLVHSDFFLSNQFNLGSVNSKTHVLMLAQKKPRSFISGAPVDLREPLRFGNRAEFHHLMPRAFLGMEQNQNCLANICILSRQENRTLGGDAPSIYRARMPPDVAAILEASFCPHTLFLDEFYAFSVERARKLAEYATELCSA
ncbi:DUF262 domain-containing protein [Arenimonas sp.]|uniref:GmrSD restriction endonuclease domain-containing protein n=1 Tax=Arenimonas sp. TaxID=1872635 RepID=UPI0039E6093A